MPTTGKRIAIGLDIGGTRLKALALQAPDKILFQTEVDSNASDGAEQVRETLRAAVQTFKAEGIVPTSIGIGCAGSVDPRTGIVRSSPNFAHFKNVPLKEWAELDFGVPVFVDNDANCAAVAEWKLGAGNGLTNFVLLTLGTGIGGGVVLNNHLMRGNTGTAGELGHWSIYADGELCPCGHRGCFERYCSGTAIRRNAGDISSKEVFARPEDPRFAPVITKFLTDFRTALVSIANVFDPEAILLGGQVSLGVAPYIPELQDWLSKHAYKPVGDHVKIRPAEFGNLSGSLGAALIALHET
jgi:glucokinase